MISIGEPNQAHLFKQVPEGWLFRSPNRWVFGHANHYLVTEAQKSEIEALLPRPLNWAPPKLWLTFAAAIMVLIGLMASIAVSFPDYPFTAAVVLIAVLLIACVVALHLTAAAKLRRLQSILANATKTDQHISLDEIRQSLSKSMTYEQALRSGIFQRNMSIAFVGLVVALPLLSKFYPSFSYGTSASMLIIYGLLMAMSSAASFQLALSKKKIADGMQTPQDAARALLLRRITNVCAAVGIVLVGAFAWSGISAEFSDLAQGKHLAAKGDHDKAIASFTKTLSADPTSYAAYIGRAKSFTAKSVHASAIGDYTKAIEIQPNSVHAYGQRAAAYSALGQNDKAVLDYAKVIGSDPTDRYAYLFRGYAYEALGDGERAMADAKIALVVDPKFDSAYNFRGRLYAAKKDNGNAVADYSKAIELNPQSKYGYVARARAYGSTNQLDAALADCSKAIAVDPRYEPAYILRGSIHASKHSYDLAISDYSKAIEIDPRSLSTYRRRAMVYSEAGARDLAIADYRKILELPAATALDRQQQEIARKSLELNTLR